MSLRDLAKNASINNKILTEQELVDLHRVLLIILDDLIEICNKSKLDFMLIGGSAIGALRNQGFIEWDDDIDIAMTRADFEKLNKIINKDFCDKYSIIHPQDKSNYGRILPKIRLKRTKYKTLLEYDLIDCGVFIDIYTIENIPDNKIIRFLHGIICLIMGYCLSCRRVFKGRFFFGKFEKGFIFNTKVFLGFLLSFVSIEKWAQWTDYWYSRCKNNNSQKVGVPSDDFHYFGELYDRKLFCRYKKVQFERRLCNVPLNYDSYLKKRYGDYMITPPDNKHSRNCYLEFDLGYFRKGMR